MGFGLGLGLGMANIGYQGENLGEPANHSEMGVQVLLE
jgi:hypothetical protein